MARYTFFILFWSFIITPIQAQIEKCEILHLKDAIVIPQEATFEMLDFLNGPTDMNTYTRQFIRERLEGKQYKTFSFFEGTSPKNNYQAKAPYKIQVSTNPYTYQDENYATLYLQSSGADNPRPIKLRKKPSTGQWFVVDYNFLADIRIPVEQDEWN